MDYFQGKLCHQGQLNTQFDMEDAEFNVMKKEISETTYLHVTDKI